MKPQTPSLPNLFWSFLKIGSTAFGGLMALISVVENVLVEQKEFLTHEDILDGISITTFIPGPISTNVVAYAGYRLQRGWGAFVSLAGVILPSFVLVVGLAIMYFNYGQIPIVNKVLLGFIPAVAAIIVSTAWKMSLQTIKGWQEASIAFISAFLLIGIGGAYLTPLIIIISGLLGCLILNKPHISLAKSHPKILAIQHSIPFLNIDIFIIILLSLWALITKRNKPKIYLRKNHPKILTIQHSIPCLKLDTAIITLLSLWALMTKRNKPKIYLEKNHPKILGIQNNISFSKIDIVIIIGLFLCAFIVNTNLLLIPEKYTLLELFVTFAGMSVMLFGGAYVGIPLMEDIIVNQHQWLSQQEFTYALTAGQITPGPIVISAAFIGYKVASILGALVATIGIFLPPTLLMITSTKILENLKSSSQVQAAIYGMRPAVIGMIFAAAWAVGKTASPEGVSILIFIITLVALVYWRLNVVWIMPLAGLIGVFLDIS